MVTYLRQDPTTNLMSPVSGVQVQPATQGQPVEISASGRIDASLLPTTYDPKIDVVAAEAVQAGDLCYLLWENGTRVIRKAVSTAWSTLSTVFVKESYAQGAAAAAYIHGVMTLVNPGTFTAADVGTSIYLSPTIPGYFQKNYPTATGQFTQRVAVITDVTESTLSCFFIGYLDRGRSAGSGLVDTDPTVTAHLTDLNNPHQVNATQVGAVSTTQVGVASGVAPLGANSLVPDAYLPVSTWKSKSVRAVMTSNVNLASPGATLDGLTMTAGDRVLLTAQTDLGAPGVYVWNSATTAMTRATDADAAAELCESIWVVAEGTQAHSVWMNTNKTIPTLGSTLLTFVRILDPGWTNPLTTSGDLLIAVTGGAASRLAAGANGLVLTMVAGLPKWSELSVSGMTNPMTDQGDIVYGGVNGVPTRLARGVAAQVLTVSNGGAPYWVAPTTGFANPMQDGGDLILGGSGGTATRLAAGNNGQVLTMVSGAVQWAAGGLTNPMTTHGDLLWGTDGGVPRRLGLGANGQVLTVVSGGLQWAAPTTGFANPMYFPGDLILGGTNGEGTRLAPGTTGQVLTITTEGPRWAGASGLTNPMTTVGDLIVGGTSGAAGRMSVGANGQVLTVVSGVPTWTAPSSGFSNPMTTAGDLIYGSTGGAGARLAAGTENQVLSMKSGFPTWVTGGGSYSDPMTTPGDMLVRGASATQRLAKGANGQVLTMVAGAPAWAAAGGGGGGMSNPMTALGDLITADASGVPQRLGVGAEGQVLKVVSGNPAWAAESGGSGGGHGEVIQEVAGTSVGTPITSCVARITPHAVGNRIHITTNAGSFRPTTAGRICISLQVNGFPVDQFTVVGSPTDLIGFPTFEFTGHAQSLDEVLITLSGVWSEVWFSDNVPINVEELDDSQMPLNIATVPRIEFAEPDANQASYYPGDVFPYSNPWTGSRQGSQWLASVPPLPGATYKWEVLGGTDIQMDYMSEVMFTARAGVSISLKCTRTASDGKVEVATAKIPVYYRAMHVEPINPNATKVWPGQVVDGVMGNPEVGFLDATMAMIPDGSGGIIFGDWGAIRRISADRSTLSLIAGAGSTNGQTGYAEGTGSAALLADEIHAIVRDVSGNGLFFSELTNHRIRTVDTVTGTTQNYIGTGSAVGVFPAGAIPIAEAVVNAPWAMAAVTDRFFFIDQDDNGRVLRYAHKSGEMQNVVVETLFNPSVNFGDFDTMTAVAAHVDGEGYVQVYVAFLDAVVLVGSNNTGTVIAGSASMLRSAQDFYNYGAMHDYVNTTAPACFCDIRSMQWVGGDNGYLVVNDAGTIRTVSPSASVATRVKTLCVALAQQSWATSPAFLFTPNPNDETLPTVIMGGFDSPPWVESPGLVLGPYVGEDGMPQAADMAKAYDVGACLAIDETCPRYTHGTVRGRMATMGWVTREDEMWHVDFYTPYTSADTYGGRVEQGSDSPVFAQMVGYPNGIDNYAHRTITQTQRVADAGVFMPVVLTVERNGGWPAPAFIYGLQVGSTASSGVASTPPWVPATVNLFDALGRIKRIYQREGDASVDYTFNYQGLSSGITRIMVRGAGGLERIRVDGAGYRATGLTPVPSDSTVALDDYLVDSFGNVI